MKALSVLGALLTLCACSGRDRRVDLPPVTKPVHIVTEKRVYVPIDKVLTQRCPSAKGPLSQVVEVARKRGACLDKLNAQLQRIEAVQGTALEQ